MLTILPRSTHLSPCRNIKASRRFITTPSVPRMLRAALSPVPCSSYHIASCVACSSSSTHPSIQKQTLITTVQLPMSVFQPAMHAINIGLSFVYHVGIRICGHFKHQRLKHLYTVICKITYLLLQWTLMAIYKCKGFFSKIKGNGIIVLVTLSCFKFS